MTIPDFFEEGSPFLRHPLLTAERTSREVSFILSQLELPAGARVLDIGCGFGRHSIQLAALGFEVVGIDPSAAMIAAAQEKAAASRVAVEFVQASAEHLVTSRPFDAVICLFTTLGQISEHGENRALVQRASDMLVPGGQLVVEVPQRGPAVANLKAFDRFGDQERYTVVTRSYSAAGHIVTEKFDLVAPERTNSYLLQYRLYDQEELTLLMNKSGFELTARLGGYEQTPLTADSPTMLFFGRKK